jgi:hypothetical protein
LDKGRVNGDNASNRRWSSAPVLQVRTVAGRPHGHWQACVQACSPPIDLYPPPSFSLPLAPFPSNAPEQAIQGIFLMSSTGRASPSASTIQVIIDAALADYTKVTGIDLSENPFAATIEHLNSPDAVLELLQERQNAFKEYRDGNQRLISYLRPAVNVIQAFSSILGEVASLVSHTCHPFSSFNDFFRSHFHQQTPCSPGSILFLLYAPRIT